MTRLLLLGALLAMFPASASARVACDTSPVRALTTYYRAIDTGRFASGWACLTPRAQAQLGGFARWRDGFRTTSTLSVSSPRLSGSTVTFRLRSCRISRGRAVVERFRGRVGTSGSTRAGWRLGRPALHRTASAARSAC